MKWIKADGSYEITVEIVEAAGDFGIGKVTDLANLVYATEQVPGKMKKSDFLLYRRIVER